MKKPVTKAVASVMMAAAMFVPSSYAAGPDPVVDITIDGSASQYSAYRLLDLTTSLKNNCGHGADGDHTDECWNYAYTVNDTYRSILQEVCGDAADTNEDSSVSDAEIVSYIGTMGDNSDEIRVFADTVYTQVKDMPADAEDTGKTFAGVPQGYYLITEKTTASDPDARSLVMLDTAGQEDITVSAKEGTPTLTKQVQETDDSAGTSAWQDAADYDMGDAVTFRLMGNMPSNIDAYGSYRYIFHDTLDNGFQLNRGSVKVSIAGQILSDGEYTVVDSDLGDDCSFEVRIDDVVALAQNKSITLEGSTQVTVEYTATLTDTAAMGTEGNDNAAYLEFSNDPYDAASTSKTVNDTVSVFTYQLQVNKTDGDDNPLSGANFDLLKYDEASGDYVAYKTLSVSGDQTEFDFVGLDAGKYKLVESQVPSGFNKAEDLLFEIVSTYDTDSDDPALTKLEIKQGDNIVSGDPGSDALFEVSLTDGLIGVTVVNNTGIHLPSTGGPGTMLITGAGVLMVAGGLVYFIVKRKKEQAEG